jgi:hypothetical protein
MATGPLSFCRCSGAPVVKRRPEGYNYAANEGNHSTGAESKESVLVA